MKQFLLATALIAIPVAGFTAFELWAVQGSRASAAAGSQQADALGDLSGYQVIVADTQILVEQGDLAAAEARITNLETKWDDAESTMRPKAPAAWGNVDAAADHVFLSLRALTPDPAKAKEALAALSATLANPSQNDGSAGGVKRIAGVTVTDENGHAIPCETMLGKLRTALSDGSIAAADKPAATGLQAKATERCNADDDGRADAFAAKALAFANH